MTTEAVEINPALAAAISMPPALVQALEKDPELLVELTRGQLAIVQQRLVQKALTDPEITLGQLATVHEALVKNAHLKGNQQGQGMPVGAQIIVNFIVGGENKPLVIEGQSQVTDVAPG